MQKKLVYIWKCLYQDRNLGIIVNPSRSHTPGQKLSLSPKASASWVSLKSTFPHLHLPHLSGSPSHWTITLASQPVSSTSSPQSPGGSFWSRSSRIIRRLQSFGSSSPSTRWSQGSPRSCMAWPSQVLSLIPHLSLQFMLALYRNAHHSCSPLCVCWYPCPYPCQMSSPPFLLPENS